MTSSLNRIFKVIWSKVQMAWVAVSEATTAHGKQQSITRITRTVTTVAMLTGGAAIAAPPAPNQLPTGGQVAAGVAAIGTNGNTMTVTQNSDRAAINWNTFDIGSQAKVQFVQPSSNAVALNRVNSPNPSQIYGQLSSNGQVYLINAAGIYFAPGAQVNVGGIVATTHSMSDAAFMAGSTTFERNGSTGKVINEGTIQTSLNGYIAMLAPEVRNSGLLLAQSGTIALAAGERIILNFGPTSKLESLIVTEAQLDTLIENRSAIKAPNGLVILSAKATNQLAASVVNSGTIEAKGVSQQGGRIILEGTTVTNTGTLDASSDSAQGGTIQINGKNISLSGTIKVDGASLGGTVKAQATNTLTANQANINASANQQSGVPAAQGGQIQLAANQLQITDTTLNADGDTQGGNIQINGVGPTNAADVLGPNHPLNNPLAPPTGPSSVAITGATTITTRSRYGNAGQTTVTGDHISLNDQTTIDATGATQGGTVLIGGDWQGSNGTYQATTVYMGQNVTIDASATDNGNGGKVVLWSDIHNANGWTNAYGNIYAKGGINGGDGGQIETSGHSVDIASADINADSPNGQGGLWLLDPYDYTIGFGEAVVIQNALNVGTSVTIDTQSSTSYARTDPLYGNPGSGNISLVASITKTAGAEATLTLNADNWINLPNTWQLGSTGNRLNIVVKANASGVANAWAGNFDGLITGNVSITKNGVGSLWLNANNTYTGPTTVNTGTLVLSGYQVQLGTSTNYNVYNGATLSFSRNDVFGTSTDNVQNTIIIYDGGTVTNRGAYFNRLGAVNFMGNGTLTSTDGALVNGSLLAWALAGSVYSGANTQALISGAGSVMLGSGSVTGTTFDINTAGNLSVSATLVNGSNNWPTPQASYLTKIGAGTLTLSGSNTYTGVTTVSGGVLAISSDANLGTAPVSATPGSLVLDGGILRVSNSFALNANRGINLTGAGGNLQVDTGITLTYGGVIAGSAGFTKSGTGSLTLSGANVYSGATAISAGTLAISNAVGLGATTAGTTVASGATLDLQGVAVAGEAITLNGATLLTSTGTSSLSGSVTLGANSNVSVSGTQLTLSGGVSGAYGLTKAGSGSLILSGTNTYSGSSNVSAGTFNVTGTLADTTVVNVSSGATYNVSNNDVIGSFVGAGNINLGSGYTLTAYGDNASGTFSGVIAGTGNLTKGGSGTLTLTGTNTYSGITTISAGTLQIGAGGTAGSIASTSSITDNGTLAFNRSDSITLSQVISGTGNLSKAGSSTLTLTGTNTYSGSTNVTAGTLQIGAGGTAGAVNGSSAVNISTGATLTINRTDALTIDNAISGAGGVTITQNNNVNITGAATYTGNTSVGGGALTFTNGNAPSTANFTGSGSILIQPSGASFSAAQTLNYNVGSAFTSLTIGNSTNTANLTIGASSSIIIGGAITLYGGNVTVNSVLSSNATAQNLIQATAGDLLLNAGFNQTNGSGSSLTLKAIGNVTQAAAADIVGSGSSTLGVVAWANSGNVTGRENSTVSLGNITTNNGSLWAGGALVPGNGTVLWRGLSVGQSGALITLNGNISLGTGGVLLYEKTGYALTMGAANLQISAATGGSIILVSDSFASNALTLNSDGYINFLSNSNGANFSSTGGFNFNGTVSGNVLTGSGSLTNIKIGHWGNSLSATSPGNLTGISVGVDGGSVTPYNLDNTTGDIAINADMLLPGSINLNGRNVALNANVGVGSLAAYSLIGAYGNVTQGVNSTLYNYFYFAGGTTGNVAATNAGNQITKLRAQDLVNLSIVNNYTAAAMNITGVTGLTGQINLRNTGDILVNGTVETTSTANATGSPALLLAAGYNQAVGTTSNNVTINGTQTLSVGGGGLGLIYTGSATNSGLTTLLGSGSGRFRYSTNLTSAGYNTTAAPLTSGLYGLYRQTPTLTLSTANASIVYGNTSSTAISSTATNGDTLAQIFGIAPTSTVSGGTSTAGYYMAGNHTINITGPTTNLLGYATPTYSNGTMTVAKANLVVTGTTAQNRQYDGSTNVTFSNSGSITPLTGPNGTDVVTLTASGNFSSKNVGTGISITMADSISGADADNYQLVQPTVSANITPRTVTLSDTQLYSGSTTLTNVTIGNLVVGETLNYTGATANSSQVADNSTNFISAITLTNQAGATAASGGLASNYQYTTLNHTSAPVTINAAPLGIAFNSTYNGGSTFNNTVSGISGYTLTGLQNGETISSANLTLANGNVTFANNYITGLSVVSGNASMSNYALNSSYNSTVGNTQNSVTLSAAPLSITANAVNMTYNGTGYTGGTVTYSGFVGSDSTSNMAGSIAYSGNSQGAVNVGNYTITPSGQTNSNYLITYNSGALTIGAAPLGITATGVYNGTTTLVPNTFAVTGLVNGETVTSVSALNVSNANVGNNIYITGLSSGGGTANLSNYLINQAYNATPNTTTTNAFTMNQAVLTVQAANAANFVGSSLPGSYSVSYSGFVAGQNIGNAGLTTGAVTNSATGSSGAGIYTLTPSGFSANNYSINYVNGTYTVVPADTLLVQLGSRNANYAAAPNLTPTSVQYKAANATIVTLSLASSSGNSYTYTDGFGGNVSFTLSPTNASLSSSGNLNAGSYQIGGSNLTQTGSINLNGTGVYTGSLAVAQQAITASGSNVSKVYDGTTAMTGLNISLSPVVSGDTLSATGNGAFNQVNAGTGIGYNVTGLVLGGVDAGNYYLTGGTTFSGSNGVINQRTVTLSANPVYNGGLALSNVTIGNLVGNETLTYTGNALSKNVQDNGINYITSLVLGNGTNGGLASNYQLPTLNVANAPVTITRLGSVTWTGGATGNWFDPANWAGGAVPDLNNVQNVIIPSGVTVLFNSVIVPPAQSGAVSIDSLTGAGGNLTQSAGTLNVGAGGITLNTLTQSNGNLTSLGPISLTTYNQTGGNTTASSNLTTQTYNQSGGITTIQGSLSVNGNYTQSGGQTNVTGNANITTANTMTLGNLTVGGALNATSTAGNINQTLGTQMSVTGRASFYAPAGIIALNPNNSFPGGNSIIDRNGDRNKPQASATNWTFQQIMVQGGTMLYVPLPRTEVKTSVKSHRAMAFTGEVVFIKDSDPDNVDQPGFLAIPEAGFTDRFYGQAPEITMLPEVNASKLVKHGERILIINTDRGPNDKISLLNKQENLTP